jgi:uncharacterized membrane protein YcaP (DUF421 family)
MKKEEIHLTDWMRILLGEVPASFYIELVIRALAVYLLLMISMRLMGKRMSSQLSRNELAALVSLAAAIGVPMLAPDRGLLPAIVIAMVVVSFQRLIALWLVKSQSFEKFSQGNVSMLVKDSVIDIKVLESVRLSKERLCAQLRSESILNLGKVKRFYMEANGTFSLVENEKPAPGLSIIPNEDPDMENDHKPVNGVFACSVCGKTVNFTNKPTVSCPNCGRNTWTSATQ